MLERDFVLQCTERRQHLAVERVEGGTPLSPDSAFGTVSSTRARSFSSGARFSGGNRSKYGSIGAP